MFRIAICEDDTRYAQFLKKIILNTQEVDVDHTQFFDYFSGEDLLDYPDKDYDLVILDMQMNGMNGYETAQKLRELDKNLLLVFCSGLVEPTPESFKVTPFRYLQKKYSDEKMLSEMKEILEEMKLRKSYPYVVCKCGINSEKIRVYPDSVLYIAIKNDTTEIFPYGKLKKECGEKSLRASLNLEAVYGIFNERCGFTRAHNSYIINMEYIIAARRESVTLIDGTILTVSRARSKEFRAAFARYMARKYKGE